MSYTTLAIGPDGAFLADAHRVRLSRGDRAVARAFDAWLASAPEGTWTVRVEDGRLEARPRAATRLVDGIVPVVRTSPLATRPALGAIPKPAPPCLYDAVRPLEGVTLLTSGDGAALWEAGVAALVAWDGRRSVLVPEATPRVASLAEAHLAAQLGLARDVVPTDGAWPLLLLNAVALTCAPLTPGRGAFPPKERETLHQALMATARR